MKQKIKALPLSKRLLSDLQWAAQEDSEYLLSARDCKALLAAIGDSSKRGAPRSIR